jgi:hypothetical protein
MALIKCTECGNDVSEIALVGSAFIAMAPLLTYVTVGLNLPGAPSSYAYNMWTVLSPEAGGLKSGESAGFYGLVPTLILILGVIGVILAAMQIVRKTEIKVFIRALVPVLAAVLFVLFETAGLTTFREISNQFTEVLAKKPGLL